MEIWHGTHNNFILYENKKILKRDIIKHSKKYNVDGIIILNLISKNIIKMIFYNRDGTKDNCGNGLRVAAKYFYDKNCVNKTGMIISLGQTFRYYIKNNKITISFKNINKKNNIWDIGGVPHKVYKVKSIQDFREKAKKLRYKYNTNITLVREVNNNIFAQTFEVGVENFTYSCGTGSIAAALETGKKCIFMPGGLLKIRNKNKRILLTGNAIKIKHDG